MSNDDVFWPHMDRSTNLMVVNALLRLLSDVRSHRRQPASARAVHR